MRTLKLFSFASILLLGHCNKSNPPPLPKYTVTGVIINGTTGQPIYPGDSIQLEVRTQPKYGNVQSAILAKGIIDYSGRFNFTYTQTNITGGGAFLRIDLQIAHFGDFPVNQNVNQILYFSSLGSLKIYMYTKNPLGTDDTLFFAYEDFNLQFHFDTIRSTINGYYKTIRTPPPSVGFFWGRGANNFIFNSSGVVKGFTKVGGTASANVTGDPVVDSVTINY